MRPDVDKADILFVFHKLKHYAILSDNSKSPVLFVFSMKFMRLKIWMKWVFKKRAFPLAKSGLDEIRHPSQRFLELG